MLEWLLARHLAIIAALFALAVRAFAAEDDYERPFSSPETNETAAGAAASSSGSLWSQEHLINGGDRAALEARGLAFNLDHQAEVWTNTFGGLRRGTIYNGLTTASLTAALDKLIGWHDAKFFVSGFDIQGQGPSTSLVGNLQLISNIEATPDVKLYDLWLEQELFEHSLSVRLGQEGANDEMMLAPHAAVFLNSSFGFPGLPAADLPSGGPNYPMAAPFARVRLSTENLSFTGALFTNDPAPPGPGDPQKRDAGGVAFRLNDHGLSFAELAYEESLFGLPGTLKVGAWYSSARLLPREAATVGDETLPGGSGGAAIYGIADQLLWKAPGSEDAGIAAFAMAMGTPSTVCFSDLYLEGGLNWKGPLPTRAHDVLGLAVAYLHLDPGYQSFANQALVASGAPPTVRSNETVIEATYFYEITPWWTLQPDLQLVINPRAGLPSPVDNRPLSNALVSGARMTVKF